MTIWKYSMKTKIRNVRSILALDRIWKRLTENKRIWESKHNDIELSGTVFPLPEIRVVDRVHMVTTIYRVNSANKK